ncbi:hypothetical protein EVAR_56877_1 [Eumeta japonica]|uniref:Uncharacterized protein n=1 Tax=Eumeta variegata TaxID=151549 RepID=A0A4C1ZAS4_EUMVA|nr:hypothetical protein EVAR_56877_1 [Eumeta japonica]
MYSDWASQRVATFHRWIDDLVGIAGQCWLKVVRDRASWKLEGRLTSSSGGSAAEKYILPVWTIEIALSECASWHRPPPTISNGFYSSLPFSSDVQVHLFESGVPARIESFVGGTHNDSRDNRTSERRTQKTGALFNECGQTCTYLKSLLDFAWIIFTVIPRKL